MMSQNMVKVIKRAERRPHARQDAEPCARGKTRATAATVKEWVSEFIEGRPARYREIRQQLGWPEFERERLKQPTTRAAREGEE